MADTINFYGWERSGVYDLAAGPPQEGRLVGSADLSVRDNGQTIATHTATFHIMGPPDVAGIDPRAIRRTMPRSLSQDNETTKCVHIEFRAADFAWRYTPQRPSGAALRPWIVVLVGPAENLIVDGNKLDVDDETLIAHDLRDSARWAHVHEEGGKRFSRLLSPRSLMAQREYVAAVVPAFNAGGLENWVVSGAADFKQLDERPDRLACYYHWRFWTGEGGDFETLSAALQVRPNDGSLGQADLLYERNAVSATLAIRGAITALAAGQPDPDPPPDVLADLDNINNEVTDPRRPVITMPNYGRPWRDQPETTDWGAMLNNWPQHRGIAGLGLWIGIEAQDALSAAAVEQSGALGIAAQRIRALAAGLVSSQSLWHRRLPADPSERLVTLGPTMRRMRGTGATKAKGSVLDLVTGPSRPLPRTLFSSGARRLFRPNTPQSRHLSSGIVPPLSVLLPAANQCPPLPDKNPPGLPHLDTAAVDLGVPPLEELLGIASIPPDIMILINSVGGLVVDIGLFIEELGQMIHQHLANMGTPLDLDTIMQELVYLEQFDGQSLDADMLVQIVLSYFQRTKDVPAEIERMVKSWHREMMSPDVIATELANRISGHTGLDPADLFDALRPRLDRYQTRPVYSREVLAMVNHYFAGSSGKPPEQGEHDFDPTETPEDVIENTDPMPAEPCRPVDLDILTTTVEEAIDPTADPSIVVTRVLETIQGIGDSIAPPEVCLGLDFPVWGLLRQYAKEWLLPGVGQLQKDSIVAMESNPSFIDAFLVGLNTQLMNELHWRNIAIHPACTPLRMFWGQVDYAGNGQRMPDIKGIDTWPTDTDLGDTSHQVLPPDDAAGKRDLVMVFRTDLFRRYPHTLVYLVAAGESLTVPPTFNGSEARLGPIFQGRIEEDIVFFTFDINPDDLDDYWVVLEEPPADLRFRNDQPSPANNGAQFAQDILDRQTRVAISGAYLEWTGTPT